MTVTPDLILTGIKVLAVVLPIVAAALAGRGWSQSAALLRVVVEAIEASTPTGSPVRQAVATRAAAVDLHTEMDAFVQKTVGP